MASTNRLLALSALVAAALPIAAAAQAPAGTPDTRYCMKVAALTGSHVERVRCWTREQWADQGVDLDRDWPKEGVRILD